MANQGKRLSYSKANPVAALFVAPDAPIPDNCSVVRLTNAGGIAALYGEDAVGAAAAEGVNCSRLFVGQTLDIPVQPLTRRGALVLNYASTAGAVQIDIVYLSDLGVAL